MPLSGYEATLSNLSASLVGTPKSTAISVCSDARDAIASGRNPYLEYDRVREIRKCSPETTYDLITSDHHFIANGVVTHNCDIRINNDLDNVRDDKGNQVNFFTGIENCWLDHSFDRDAKRLLSEEEIYDLIIKDNPQPPPGGSFGNGSDPDDTGDLVILTAGEKQQVVNTVVQAVQQAKIAGQAGTIPGDVETILKHFLEPVIPWQQLLMRFFTDMLDEDYTWRRPNRRSQDIYLPCRFTDDGRLEHLVYFLDVSGSISDHDILRFNSEVKYIQEQLNPEKLTLVQFDTKIQDIKEFVAGQPFDEIKVTGRGGTCLIPVRAYIEKHKPTAAVVFSDMWVEPMAPLTIDVPMIWAVYNNPRATVPFGKMVHIK